MIIEPFKIVDKITSVSYRLDLPTTYPVHPVIYVSYLYKFYTPLYL